MKSLLDDAVREEMIGRVKKLRPDSVGRFGTMSCHQMICHTADGFRISFREIDVKAPKGPLNSAFGRWFAIDCPIPWPKGKLKSPPQFFVATPGDFETDRQTLIEYIERFAKGEAQDWGESVLLGKLSGAQWGRMQYRHLNHHLSQFGV